MKILILGEDGYLGTPLRQYLEKKGHDVIGVDNFVRRHRAPHSLTELGERKSILSDAGFIRLSDYDDLDAVVHLAQQPSAPWSMIDQQHAMDTQLGNIASTMNLLWQIKDTDIHLVKLGSMGEWGTPEIRIPEGFIEYGDMAGMAFPKQPNSFYHLSKYGRFSIW